MEEMHRGNPVELRILKLIERHPGSTVNELAMRVSGMTPDNVKKAIERLFSKGTVRREKRGLYVWFVAEQPDAKPLPGRTKNIFTNYTPPKQEIARPDALAHQAIPSRRGDDLEEHKPPASMLQGKLTDKRPHTTAVLSPIKSATFCKQSPKPPVKRPAPVFEPSKHKQAFAFQRLHDESTVAKALELRAQGVSYPKIAAAIGVSVSSVERWCTAKPKETRQPVEAAVKMPPRRKPPQMAFNARRRSGAFTLQGASA